mgnify:CR=1 FL=1
MIYAVLCSGNLGFNILSNLYNELKIKFVFTDNKSTDIINFCKENNILLFKGNPRNGKANEFIANNKLATKKVDVIISVNYLFIIDKQIIDLASKIAFNVHGSLLPKYRGRTPHVWSIINNEKYAGITAHIIDNGCDTGDIIEQVKFRIGSKDTGASLLEKYNLIYLPLIKKVISKINSNSVILKKQNNLKATYFGKRVPEDGQINWDWQKERIYNWVRAQAYPYPGAFTHFNQQKLVIDEVRFSNFGFNYNLENGKILSLNPLIVKVQNGCLEIIKYRGDLQNIKLNEVFKNDNR